MITPDEDVAQDGPEAENTAGQVSIAEINLSTFEDLELNEAGTADNNTSASLNDDEDGTTNGPLSSPDGDE
jgi:hypothetical protein